MRSVFKTYENIPLREAECLFRGVVLNQDEFQAPAVSCQGHFRLALVSVIGPENQVNGSISLECKGAGRLI